jgi:hypothetical protein
MERLTLAVSIFAAIGTAINAWALIKYSRINVVNGLLHPMDTELSQLKKENARLKEDVEILKKAAGIFLSRSGKDTQ